MKRRTQTDEKTQPRKVSLTVPEWEEIKRQADRKGVSRSRYIAERALRSDGPTGGSEDIFDLLFAYREAVRALNNLLDAVSASPSEIDILHVVQRLNRLNENFLRGLQYVVGESWTDGSDPR
jgi:ACT domain-containing protein